MAHDISHDDTITYGLPAKGGWQRRIEAELDPYAVVDDHTTEITAIVPPGTDGPWPPEIIMAVMRLRSRVALCERDTDGLKRLGQYLGARADGRANPLGNLRQYQDIQYDVNDAVQLFTPCGGMDEWFTAALARHGGAS